MLRTCEVAREDGDVDDVIDYFKKKRLTHLRARRRADLVVVESGPAKNPIAHVRFRRVCRPSLRARVRHSHRPMAATGFDGSLDDLLDTLMSAFPWVLRRSSDAGSNFRSLVLVGV